MTSAIASSGDELGAAMRDAGFRYVFLGIENVLDQDLAFLKARPRTPSAKAAAPSAARRMRAVDVLHRHGMLVVGGLIVGNPGDTRESIEANLDVRAAVRRLAVHPASDAVPGHADDERLPRARG